MGGYIVGRGEARRRRWGGSGGIREAILGICARPISRVAAHPVCVLTMSLAMDTIAGVTIQLRAAAVC